ncbi:unnamed protein product [Boreogadus saida]
MKRAVIAFRRKNPLLSRNMTQVTKRPKLADQSSSMVLPSHPFLKGLRGLAYDARILSRGQSVWQRFGRGVWRRTPRPLWSPDLYDGAACRGGLLANVLL